MKLFLKGERCYTDKCSFDRRPYPPGQHGQRRTKITEYGVRLREKQKVRRMYGAMEKQFRRYFTMADGTKGVTGENLLRFLERRLDNVIRRASWCRTTARSRPAAEAESPSACRGRKRDGWSSGTWGPPFRWRDREDSRTGGINR